MSDGYKVCKRCHGSFPIPDLKGNTCPLCHEEALFDEVMKADQDSYKVEFPHPAVTLTHVAEWSVRNPRYFTISILASLGSFFLCFIPGWGALLGAVCTIVATITGFKAGYRYRKETSETLR